MGWTIRRADRGRDLPFVRELFREYADSLGIDLGFQGFSRELAGLPGPYDAPLGCILLAEVDGRPSGCAALKPLVDGIGEMKRLYVRPGSRGLGLGRALAERVIAEAKEIGHRRLRLDTIPSKMGGVVAFYRLLGFAAIPPYCENPFPDALFLERELA